MLQNTNVPENSQRIGAGMPGVVTWGVIGGGDSARRFAVGLRHVTGAKLASVWTRKREVAEAFAAHFGGATTCTLEQMLSGPVDAVYIATHPDSHHAYALAALAAGKHVLCEKPSMLNGQQLDEVLVAASIRGLLFMEAMKPPFFPLYRRLREHLEQDPIGQIAFVRAGSSIADIPLNHPIYNLDVGGGSLLGIGPYEAFLALDWLGPVEQVQTFGQIGPTGIDTFAADYDAKYPKAVASLRRDQAQLLTFYDFPAEHWRHLRTTNIIESPFATVRLRQRVTKGAGSRTKALMMAFKLLAMAEERWRKVNGSELLPLVRAGVRFIDGVQEKPTKTAARKVKENAA